MRVTYLLWIYLLWKAWGSGKEFLKLPPPIPTAFLLASRTEHAREKGESLQRGLAFSSWSTFAFVTSVFAEHGLISF